MAHISHRLGNVGVRSGDRLLEEQDVQLPYPIMAKTKAIMGHAMGLPRE